MADDPKDETGDFYRRIGLALSPYQLIEEQLKLYIEVAHFEILRLVADRIPFRCSRDDYENAALEWLIKMFKRHCDNDDLVKRLKAALKKRNYVAHNVVGRYMQHGKKDPTIAQSILADLEAIKEEGWDLVEQLNKEFDKLKATSSAWPRSHRRHLHRPR